MIKFMKLSLFLGILQLLSFVSISSKGEDLPWRITHAQWTAQDENEFGEFVSKIGFAVSNRKCFSVATCLTSKYNPYYSPNEKNDLKYFADCADFPYYMRGYFAWKKGLPFSFSDRVEPRLDHKRSWQKEKEEDSNVIHNPHIKKVDLRYTDEGNMVTSVFQINSQNYWFFGRLVSAREVLDKKLVESVHSGMYRILGETFPIQNKLSDFYPIRINKQSIRAGTVVYNSNGHIALVYRVSKDGRVYFIDAHPDNSLTSGIFDSIITRSWPGHGAGFKNFRPIQLIDASWSEKQGSWMGGRMVYLPNEDLPDFSLEQYFGSLYSDREAEIPQDWEQWKNAEFTIEGDVFSFIEYIRRKLSEDKIQIDPLEEMSVMTQTICESIKDRVLSVDAAIKNGIDKEDAPEKLPENIFGASGKWESYATPSRDFRLRRAFLELFSQVQNYLIRMRAKDPNIKYQGLNPAKDLLNQYLENSGKCIIKYKNSEGSLISLNFEQVRERLWLLSFDPYQCVELRWGASQKNELNSCPSDTTKKRWYVVEQYFRNFLEQNYQTKMDYTLDDLENIRSKEPEKFNPHSLADSDIREWLYQESIKKQTKEQK